jgi:hypothetical protein
LVSCVVNISVTDAECIFDLSADVATCLPETSLTLII